MHYRVVQFQPSQAYPDGTFFVETGEDHKEKTVWLFWKKVTVWSTLMDPDSPADKPRALKYKNFNEALAAIVELKKMQPYYHEIK